MIDFLSDLIAYPIVGFLSMLGHVVTLSDDASNETVDQMDEMTRPGMVARWRYKVNHALGGTHPLEDYAKDENQELKSCGCGCGCGCGCLVVLVAAFVLFLLVAT